MANLPALTPTNFAEALQFAEQLAKSTMIPREFQRNPSNVLVAIQWGAELGLGPMQALQNIAVVNGRPSVYGDAMLALVRGSPLCEDVIEHFEGQGDNLTAICEARRKGSAPVFARFSVADAKKAGLWGKAGPWTQYDRRMLQMRARGFCLRDAFADILRGVISAEEAADIPRTTKDITSMATQLDEFAAQSPDPEPEPTPEPEPDEDEPDEAEEAEDEPADDLVAVARAITFKGYADFRQWYSHEINDDDRIALRPYIKSLQAAARAADKQPERGTS